MNNIFLQVTPINHFERLSQIFHFQKNPKWYVLCSFNNNSGWYWKPYPSSQQQIINGAYYGQGAAGLKITPNDHATYSVFVGARGTSQFFNGTQTLPSREQIQSYQQNTSLMPSGQQVSLNGFEQQQIIYSIPINGNIGGVGIDGEEIFETNFTFRYQGATTTSVAGTRRNSNNLVVECLEDIFYLLP